MLEPHKLKIVCETGSAHKKSYARCLAMIDTARQVGADAVKFSAFLPDEMTLNKDRPPFVIESPPWNGLRLYDIYFDTFLPYEWFPDLRQATINAGLEFIVSVYHPNTVPWLSQWGCRTVKVASFEIGYIDLLQSLAREEYVKRVILSTGGAKEKEIKTAVEILESKNITLLYCVSAYPAKPENMNLLTLMDMKAKYPVSVGLSDHTVGMIAPVMAVSMGAEVIEKHMKLDDDNLDATFAIFPDRFKAMVDVCRQAEQMMGSVHYNGKKTFHRKRIDNQMVRVVW